MDQTKSRSLHAALSGFAETLMRWFAANMRPLPWRAVYDPYSVWISEIMLQQTQMERGVRYFNSWMRLFPDIRAVAEAGEETVFAAWEGLGYYARAKNLHAAAKRIVREHGGEFPRTVEAIRALPGVGDYTAGAIASIAFNLPEPAVDANVLRVFARILDIGEPVTDKAVKERVAEQVRALMPVHSPRLFNQAIMELGALVCAKTAKCGQCPVAGFCAAHKQGTVAHRPVAKAKNGYSQLETVAGVVLWNGSVFIQKRPPTGLWAGLWEFPGGQIGPDETAEEAARRHVAACLKGDVAVQRKIGVVRHGYTTNRVTMRGFLFQATGDSAPKALSEQESRWIGREEIERFAFPAGHRKLLERLGWKATG